MLVAPRDGCVSTCHPNGFLLSQLPTALPLQIHFQSANTIGFAFRGLHIHEAGENGSLAIKTNVYVAFRERFVVTRSLSHLSDIFGFALSLSAAMSVDQVVRKEPIKRGLVLLN